MSDRKPCRTSDCEGTVGVNVGSDFCFACAADLRRSADELWGDLEKVLRLEAAFQAYCREHNLPDPHE